MKQRKNWLPPVFGPALAIDRMPGPTCFRLASNSSLILYPGPPVPAIPGAPGFEYGHPPCAMKPSMMRWNVIPL